MNTENNGERKIAMTEWISMTERKPEEDTTVLVAIDGCFINIGSFTEDGWALLPNNPWINGYDGRDDEVRVTHWMDLPVPPACEDVKREHNRTATNNYVSPNVAD
jgi:hypothetical protein